MTLLRCSGVSLVALAWLLALMAGVSLAVATAIAYPLLVLAVSVYIAALRGDQ